MLRVAGGAIALRGGVRELLDECAAAGVRMDIATATSEAHASRSRDRTAAA